jgi:hypothetical protein
MKPLPHNADLLEVAPRVIRFESAEQALTNPIRFVAYVMAYGTLEDIEVMRRYLDLDDFREVLDLRLLALSMGVPGRTGTR